MNESIPRYDVLPLQGAGPLRLGMARDEVLQVMDHAPAPRPEGIGPTLLPDRFHGGALRVHYAGDRERVEYLEFEPDGTPLDVRLFGQPVFTTPAAELLAFLDVRQPYDRDDPELGISFAFLPWELTLWRPVDPDAPPSAGDAAEDDEDTTLDPAAGRYFARLGLGVRGYVSGESDLP